MTRQWKHGEAIRSLLKEIPVNASVSATNNIIPHVSSRRAVFRLPLLDFRNDRSSVVKVEYIIADLWELQRYQIAFTRERTWLEQIIQVITEVSDKNEYGIIDFQDGVILLEKKATPNSESVQKWLLLKQELQN